MTRAEAAARREVHAALAAMGLRATSVELVSPLGPRKGMRFAYRVETADGAIVKARNLDTPEFADRVCTLGRGLEPAFAPVLHRHGSVVVEEWVDGTPLADADPTPWYEPAGALLGRLHGTRPAAGATSTRSWTEAARADLVLLQDAGELTSTEADALRTRLYATDPGTARRGLVHKDFCADNMIIDRAGALRVVDNELLALDPIGFDLGRTFHLWPMDDAAWRAFDRGYRSAMPPQTDSPTYWRIVATLVGARVFLTRSRKRLQATVELLRRLAGDDDLGSR